MSDNHLNDPTIFQHFQIQVFSAHARILTLGYKNAFSVLHVHGLLMSQHHVDIQNLERLPGECMRTEMSQFATQRQESPLIFGTRESVVLMDQRHLTTLSVPRLLH